VFSRRSGATAAYALATAGVVLLAVAAKSDTVKKADLNDGAVWVVNGSDHIFGGYVKAIGQLDGQVYPKTPAASDLDVLQHGDQVLSWDKTSGRLAAIDVRLHAAAGDGAIVPGNWQLGFNGGTVASLSDKGQLRVGKAIGDTPDPAVVGTTGTVTAKGIPPKAAMAVGSDGTVWVADSTDLLEFQGSGKPIKHKLASGAQQVTAVGSTPVVLSGGQLVLPLKNKTVDVPGSIGSRLVLQQAGVNADTVAVAGDKGLALFSTSDGSSHVVSTAGTGLPAAPLRLQRCVFAAWAAGGYAKSCQGKDAPKVKPSSSHTGALVIRENRGVVVLNDPHTGDVFDADDTAVARQNLWQVNLPDAPSNSPDNPSKDPLKHKGEDKPPLPVADKVGARPGRATVVHVLDNDTDPEGDLLVVTDVQPKGIPGVTALPAPDGQSVIVTLANGIAAPATLRYTVDDGYGKSATTTLTVEPRSSNDNEKPKIRTVKAPVLGVAPNGTLRIPVLNDWRDFDGDPLLIVNPTPTSNVVATNDGALLISAPSTPGPFTVGYSVTDGLSDPVAGPKIVVQVLDPSSTNPFIAPVARPDALRVTVGQTATITPLANDLPGADGTDPQAHLVIAREIAPRAGLDLNTDLTRGVITVRATRPGTYLLRYGAGYGAAPTAESDIRIDADPKRGTISVPVAVPDQAVLRGGHPVIVDVLANDYDPAGGMLVVQDATGDPASGIAATVIDGRSVRLVGTGVSTGATSNVHYRVSNGLGAPVDGTIAVTLLPATAGNAAPVAVDDSVTVRAGDATAVPVLNNDFDPDGDVLTLAPRVITMTPVIKGAAATISGSTVRFAAPASLTRPVQVTLEYFVQDTVPHVVPGHVSVSIVPVKAAAQDQPPTPQSLEGRLIAGDTLQVKVPVFGVDPDGDSVSVTSVVVAPSLGRIIATTADSISYQSFPTSGGTDSFTYQVVDTYGRTGQATVRLGIVPPGGLTPPLAVDDTISAVPGRTVHLDVTQNDIIQPGSKVTVLPLKNAPKGAKLEGNVLSVVAPGEKERPVTATYTITDGSGEPSSATFTVRGDKLANLPPLAQDDIPPAATELKDSVTVNVLKNDDDPDGSRDSLLMVPIDPTLKHDKGNLTVSLTDLPQQIAYVVTDPDGLTAMGVLRVPAKNSSVPHIKPHARIHVPSPGASVTVNLADIVDKPVRITTTDKLAAAPLGQVVISTKSSSSIVVAGVGHYAGPGAVSFEVTDGKTLQDKGAHTVQLTVPVQVGPEAPALRCPVTPLPVVEGGADLAVDVASLCHLWLDSTISSSKVIINATIAQTVSGLAAKMDGDTRLVITASSSAKPGAVGTIKLTVPGTLTTATLSTVVIKAPPLSVRPVTIVGLLSNTTKIVDLRDYVTSQLRDPRISIVSARHISGDPVDLPFSGSKLTIKPSKDTKGTITAQLTVTDQPGRVDRQSVLTATIEVEGHPGRPSAPRILNEGDTKVTIAWTAAVDNGAPIQLYTITGGPSAVPCRALSCVISGLHNTQHYKFSVMASNAAGDSPVSPPSVDAVPDKVPGVVPGIKLTPSNHVIASTWSVPPGNGSAPDFYQVELSEGGAGTGLHKVTTVSDTFRGLTNGGKYKLRVRAHNAAKANSGFGAWSPTVSESPYGQPVTVDQPTAQGASTPDPRKDRAIVVTFQKADGNGRDITSYTITPYVTGKNGDSPVAQTPFTGTPADFGGGSTLSKSFTVQADGSYYEYAVTATNAGTNPAVKATSEPSAKSSPPVQGAAPPDQIASVTASDASAASGPGYNGAIHATYTTPASNANQITSVEYVLNGGGPTSVARSDSAGTSVTLSIPSNNGTQVTVTVRACNDANLCGPWSPASNPVTAYGPPQDPTVSASESNQTVTYNWGGGGNNGRAISTYYVCIDGSCSNRAAGATQKGYGTGVPYIITVRATDTQGQNTGTVSRSGTTSLRPVLMVSKGPYATNGTYCTASACAYIHVHLTGYAPNSTYLMYFNTDCNTSPKASKDACLGGSTSGAAHYNSQNVTVDGAGNFDGNTRLFGYNGAQVWVDIDGVSSNHVTW
jgi:hypothetical protein